MKGTFIHVIGIMLLLLLMLRCSEKNEDNSPANMIAWTKSCSFKDAYLLWPANITETSDDGLLIAGYLINPNVVMISGFVIRMDSHGDTIWCKKIDLEDFTYLTVYIAVQKSADEIVIAGECSHNQQDENRFIAWLDASGNIANYVLYPESDDLSLYDCRLFMLDNGNILFAGGIDNTAVESTPPDNFVRIEMLNEAGEIITSKDYMNVSTLFDGYNLLADGKMALAGRSYSGEGSPEDFEMLFIQIDESGNVTDRKEFGTDAYDNSYSLCTDNSGGYIIAGMHPAGGSVLYPINASGELGSCITVADTIYSYGTVIKNITGGEYMLLIRSYSRLYFLRMGTDLAVKSTSWIDNPCAGTGDIYEFRNVISLNDGAFAFLICPSRNTIIRTKPFN